MDELNILITAIGAIFLFLALLSDYFRRRIIWNAYSIRLLPKNIISAILLENKRSNARSIYSSKFGFDFNFFMWMGRVEIIPVLVLFTSLLRPVRQAIRMKKWH
ncbi:MAG: hypothetical protein ACHBN1_01495 [Heteroscytonema crispum UTEX LB 1556]